MISTLLITFFDYFKMISLKEKYFRLFWKNHERLDVDAAIGESI